MRFSLHARLTYDFPGPSEVLLRVEAARGPDQSILAQSLNLLPTVDAVRRDDLGFHQCTVFNAQGRVCVEYQAKVEVERREHDLIGAPAAAIRDLPADVLPYLFASRYCPSDRMERFVEREFGRLAGGDKVAAIARWIGGHVDYKAGVSHAGTTAIDTFMDRAGVCRDFSHLLIALCRAADIPARAVSAYAWRLNPPDLHAVAEVYVGDRWRLVDATGLAPISGLVRVATGRDAADIAFMTVFGAASLVEQTFSINPC